MYQDLGFAAPPCTGHRFRGVAIGGDLKVLGFMCIRKSIRLLVE